jgi:hypothetical protein
LITEETALLYCTNKMKMVQRIDALSLHKPRKSASNTSMFADLKMHEEEKLRNKFKH